ncbi:MAG: DUF4333 domain-containing protein [Actinomycetota bacterium]|nr:DUF4333 domain-containing protein [Actinomycetota bacterium]
MVVALAAGTLAALPGCGATDRVTRGTIDEQRTEGMIEATMIDKGDAEQAKVDCPGGVPVEEGDTFRCTGTADGKPITVDVTQRDGEGTLSWKVNGL